MHEVKYPNPAARKAWAELVGLDSIKAQLLETLELLLEPSRLLDWQRQHHPKGLKLASLLTSTWPLIVLEGDVGCGKSALASCVGDPLASRLQSPIVLLEAPGNIRGTGLVGEISTRIAETFKVAREKVPRRGYVLLVLDEGDDVATSREQLQAHHEDRAGVNALLKELDRLVGEPSRIAVVLITNRGAALDPALLRRASLRLHFDRPRGAALRALLRSLFAGISLSSRELETVAQRCERELPYTPSDLVHRVGRAIVLGALQENRAVALSDVLRALDEIEPTPPFGRGRRNTAEQSMNIDPHDQVEDRDG
ncbi:MAG: ATP-binding protein [Nannocystaceae bacterium]